MFNSHECIAMVRDFHLALCCSKLNKVRLVMAAVNVCALSEADLGLLQHPR